MEWVNVVLQWFQFSHLSLLPFTADRSVELYSSNCLIHSSMRCESTGIVFLEPIEVKSIENEQTVLVID